MAAGKKSGTMNSFEVFGSLGRTRKSEDRRRAADVALFTGMKSDIAMTLERR